MTFNLVKDYVFPGFFLHLPLNSILCLLLLCTWFIETLFKWTFFASNLHWWKIPSKKKFSLWMDFIYLLWIALGLFLFFELQTDYFILSPATLQEQLLFDNYWLGAFKRSLSELSSLFALVPESWSSTWYDWLNNQKTPNSFLKNWNKKGWRCWCKNHVHYHLVYFQAGVRAMFWEIREEKRLRDFPSSKTSKGKLRGPMIYYELRGRFPSSVFAEDGFCCHSMLGPVARVVRLLLSREESSLIFAASLCVLPSSCTCRSYHTLWDLVEPAWLWESWDTK